MSGRERVEAHVVALADALGNAGVERGYVGADAFRQTVARRLLSDPAMRDLLAEAKADAWDEGHEVCCEDYEPVCHEFHPNPYRETTTGGRDD